MRIVGRAAAVVLIVVAARSVPLTAQIGPTLEPLRSFDVLSVKLNPSRTRTPMMWQPGGRFVMGLPIFSLVMIGYGVPAYRIEGLPDWARTTFFDINAQAGRQPEIDIDGTRTRVLIEQTGAVDVTRLGELHDHLTAEEQWGVDLALETVLGLE